MSPALQSDRKRQRKAKRLARIELLERRDVIGEWLVGLAGVGLAATAQSPPGDDAPIAFGSYSTAQLGGLVNRGLASILAGYAAPNATTVQDASASVPANSQATNETTWDGSFPSASQAGWTPADITPFETR